MKRRSRTAPAAKLRRGRIGDIDALVAIERAVFTTDLLSRRSFRRFLAASGVIAAVEADGALAGYALVLYPLHSKLARLYSIAVAPHCRRRGIGPLLLNAAEDAARRQGRTLMRLEVQVHNRRAIARYKKAGYRLFGKSPHYYDDGTDALRFEKPLGTPPRQRLSFHKST